MKLLRIECLDCGRHFYVEAQSQEEINRSSDTPSQCPWYPYASHPYGAPGSGFLGIRVSGEVGI